MRWKLIAEFALLFVLLPLGFRFKPFPFPIIPALWLLTIYCLFRLLRDPSFDRTLLWNSVALRTRWLQIFILFLVLAALIAAGIYSLHPDWLFTLVRRAPWFWLLVMALYPVLSVYPQGVVFRAFLFQRYRQVFRGPVAITIASALAFAFAHIVFRNWIAVSFTLVGGIIFAWRYRQSQSLLTSAFEHALYGCWMFTVGLGDFFYRGMR
ncbi:MAG TPA: CPBP family intramembrane glutamic endopeptidase [Terriglobales bacterium]|jgi:membrane protease YdiL (CAAX protease family)